MTNYQKAYEDILNYVESLEIIDTHEHLASSEDKRNLNNDFLTDFLSHYLSSDLISAGLSKVEFDEINNKKLPIKERWMLVEPHWNNCRYTGYGRAVLRILNDLYGFDDMDSSNISKINDVYMKTFRKGYFREILKDRCNIKISILDNWDNCIPDPEFFVLALHINRLIMPEDPQLINTYEKETGIKVNCFNDWLLLVDKYIGDKILSGCRIMKCSLAYERNIEFNIASRKTAEAEFNNAFGIMKTKSGNALFSTEKTKKFQDFMLHYILKIAAEYKIAVQFHTGLQEGNGNDLRNSNPLLLTNLFLNYPDVVFDIFHIGYPFYMEAGVLSKNFPNVFLDMCWAHIISPNASVNALLEWLDTVPINKISAFGGDYLFVEGVYGHLAIARENVSRALAIKVTEGAFNLEEAKKIAKMLFFDNPNNLFKLGM